MSAHLEPREEPLQFKPLVLPRELAFPSACHVQYQTFAGAQMSEITDYGMTTDDDDLPISITHSRDMIIFGGRIEQDYRFLDYRFKVGEVDVEARMYLDDPWTVSITAPIDGTEVPSSVLGYFKKRFNLVRQLGGPDGYVEIWVKPSTGR